MCAICVSICRKTICRPVHRRGFDRTPYFCSLKLILSLNININLIHSASYYSYMHSCHHLLNRQYLYVVLWPLCFGAMVWLCVPMFAETFIQAYFECWNITIFSPSGGCTPRLLHLGLPTRKQNLCVRTWSVYCNL